MNILDFTKITADQKKHAEALSQRLIKHLGTEELPAILDFCMSAIEEKINYQSQEEPQEKICPHCNGSCEILIGLTGGYVTCETCNGYGVIEE